MRGGLELGRVTDEATVELGAAALTPGDPGPRPEGVDPRFVSLLEPASMAAEAYRLLRYHCEQLQRSAGVTVIGVTSPGVGDGKTTTAVNLAGALAQAAGTRVLLVDGDLRRPAVGPRLGIEDGPGFAGAILDPRVELASVTHHLPSFNLAVLPAGRAGELPYELLCSPRVGELLSAGRGSYDFVVVDTPPLLVVPDTRALAAAVDGFLIVLAAHKTPRPLVAEALGALEPEKVLGIAFNNDDRPLSGYYKRYYGSYGRPAAKPRWWQSLVGRRSRAGTKPGRSWR